MEEFIYRRNKKKSDGSRQLSSGKANGRNDLDTESNRNSAHITVPNPPDESYKIIISNTKHQPRTLSGLAIVDLDSTQHPIDQQTTSLFTESISHQEAYRPSQTNPNPLPNISKVSVSKPTQRSSQVSADAESLFFGRQHSRLKDSSKNLSRIESIKRGNVNIPLDDYNI